MKTEFAEIVLATANVPTAAGNVYTEEALRQAASVFSKRQTGRRVLMGEMAAPRLNRVGAVTPQNALYIDIENVSHEYENVRFADGKLLCDARILDTPKGQLIKEVVNRGNLQPTFSLRTILTDGVTPNNITKAIFVAVDVVGFDEA